MPGKESYHQVLEKYFKQLSIFFSPCALVHCILAFCIEICLIKLKPDAALLVEDDEADCGNVVGVCIGWARLLRTHLVFSGIFEPILGGFKI